MNVAVVWIDREHARLFLVSIDKMERKTFVNPHKTIRVRNADKSREERVMFQEVGNALEGADRILILGPGMAKHHFRNFMNEQKPLLAKKIAGVETVDQPCDTEIAAMAKEFLEKASA